MRNGVRTQARARLVVAVVVFVVVAAGTAGEVQPALAASPVGTYPSWTLAGANPSWTGAVSFAGVTNFPATSFATNSTTPSLPSGSSAFLNAGTPFGARFGSSQNFPYLSLRTASGLAPSTTTFTFATPTPAAGWGFALGDIDADQVTVTATASDGSPVPVAALGFQGSFNNCATTPRPSSCSGPATDLPTWNPATSTLSGNVLDTSGASGWFAPSVPLKTLTFLYKALSGIPIYQVWFATQTVQISGLIVEPGPDNTGTVPIPGVAVDLDISPGVPVLDAAGEPVVAVTGADGTFDLAGIVAGTYVLDPMLPPEFEAISSPTITVNAAAGDVAGIDFELAPELASAPSPAAPVPATPNFTG